MKDFFNKVIDKDQEQKYMKIVIFILDNLEMIKKIIWEYISFIKVAIIMDSLKIIKDMVQVN